jgi:hypothetical protein
MAKRVKSKRTKALRVLHTTKVALWECAATAAVCGAIVGVMMVALRIA